MLRCRSLLLSRSFGHSSSLWKDVKMFRESQDEAAAIVRRYLSTSDTTDSNQTNAPLCTFVSAIQASVASCDGSSCVPRSPFVCPDTHRLLTLLISSSSHEGQSPKHFGLRILRDVNAGRTTRTHAQSVLRELLFQNHFLLHHPTEEFTALLASEASHCAFDVLQLEVLSLLATLAATCPTSTTPLLDCCHYVDEMCTIIRHLNWNCNRKVNLSVARRCLGGMLPLLPKATPTEVEAFKKTLKNCYTERLEDANGGEAMLRFTFMDKIHFVLTVYVPFMTLHYCVEPLLRSERNTRIGILVAIAALGMFVYNSMYAAAPPMLVSPLPSKPSVVSKDASRPVGAVVTVESEGSKSVGNESSQKDLLAKFIAAANEK